MEADIFRRSIAKQVANAGKNVILLFFLKTPKWRHVTPKRRHSDDRGPARPDRDRTGPDRTRLDWTGPDGTRGPHRTGPDQTGPDWMAKCSFDSSPTKVFVCVFLSGVFSSGFAVVFGEIGLSHDHPQRSFGVFLRPKRKNFSFVTKKKHVNDKLVIKHCLTMRARTENGRKRPSQPTSLPCQLLYSSSTFLVFVRSLMCLRCVERENPPHELLGRFL